ncbi:MAG: BatD family protein [Balneolaceae bacterium]
MIKIGKQSLRFFYFLIVLPFVLLLNSSYAQDFTVQSTVSENRIFSGEQFTLQIEITGSAMSDVSLPEPPEIPSTRLLSSTPSRSTSISIVNGRTTTAITYSYSYVARSSGNFTIPAITVNIGQVDYETEPIDIEILDRGQITGDGSRQMPDIFLELDLNTETPVIGEQIVASIILYFKQGIEVSSFQPSSGWRTDGFWKEELENIRQPQAESTILNGVRYRKAALMRYALFPTRSGELSLSEFSMNVGVRKEPSRNDPFGSFFGSGANQRRLSLESEPLTLNVRDLPEIQNALTINAVGDINLEREISSNRIETGETVELVTTVQGTGNIPLIRRPEYTLPEGLERYTPQENSNVERKGLTIRGSKSFSELISARAPGRYQIPSSRVAVFNPDLNRYDTFTLPEITFEVVPGQQVASGDTGSSFRLQPVTGLASWTHTDTSAANPFMKIWFWLLFILPAAIFVLALRNRRLFSRLQGDKEFARLHFAEQKAQDLFLEARNLVNDGDAKAIYNTLHKAITGYISDKLALPEAGLSDEEILEKISEKGVSEATKANLRKQLEKFATISYAPTGGATDFRSDIIKSEKLFNQLKEELE